MIFEPTKLSGAFIIKPTPEEDDRGFFARTFCRKEFIDEGLNPNVVQCSMSHNKKKGTFRGMHYQQYPHREEKIVTCIRGAVLDFIVDLRPESETYREWLSVPLSDENREFLYIPKSFAHGFITTQANTTLLYQMTEFYFAECARGFRLNDPAFAIQCPHPIRVASERDLNFPDFFSATIPAIRHDWN